MYIGIFVYKYVYTICIYCINSILFIHMYVCIYRHIYMCVYIYMHMYIFLHVCLHLLDLYLVMSGPQMKQNGV